ncbi:MAG: hypothetical protein ACI4OY_06930 [Aristaeellaceae bacterium]
MRQVAGDGHADLHPLRIFLREIQAIQGMAELIKYALIVVSTALILCLYPFLQQYFAKGVMIGSLKG